MSCECDHDGYCQRYQRQMRGRFREICRNINVDIGTAAAFRAQWARETNLEPFKGPPTPLLLKTDQLPGDAVAMTAAVYSLHEAHPGKFTTAVESRWPEVFEHNPDVVPASSDALDLRMHYPAIHDCNTRAVHFMQAWCEHLSAALEIDVPLMTDRPHLYFQDPVPSQEDYWIICSGGKSDFTTKLWGWRNYQEVVEMLHDKVRFVQVGAAVDAHPPLRGAENLVGKTSLRELFCLVRRASGVLCGVSLLMHVAAALEKPAIVIAGGREPVAWNAYPRQQYVHTIGSMPCRSVQGHTGVACWRSRTVPCNDGTAYDKDTCERPVNGAPECMRRILPIEIVQLVNRCKMFSEPNTVP